MNGDALSDAPIQVLPVDALDPPAQVLADVHGERVIVELVHLFQVLAIQHLELAPLRHLRVQKVPFKIISAHVLCTRTIQRFNFLKKYIDF